MGGGLWGFVASFNFIIKYLELSPGNQLNISNTIFIFICHVLI